MVSGFPEGFGAWAWQAWGALSVFGLTAFLLVKGLWGSAGFRASVSEASACTCMRNLKMQEPSRIPPKMLESQFEGPESSRDATFSPRKVDVT